MKRRFVQPFAGLVGAFILFLVMPTMPVWARQSESTVQPPAVRHWVDKITESIATERYSRADSLLTTLRNGNDPVLQATASVLSVSTALAKAVDLANPAALALFEAQEAEAVGKLDTSPFPKTDPDYYLLLGILEAARAQYYNDLKASPLKAVKPAGRSADALTRAVELDPSLNGARVPLALYHFWKSHVLRSLTWTPFVADKRDSSVATLFQIARSDSPYSVSAAIGLSWALIELNRPLEAAQLADSMAQALGESPRGLLEPAGKGYYLAGRWELAQARYDSLLTSLRQASRQNLAREVGILHRLAHIAAAQSDWQMVIDCTGDALSLPLTDEQWKHKQDDKRRLEELQQKASRELDRSQAPADNP